MIKANPEVVGIDVFQTSIDVFQTSTDVVRHQLMLFKHQLGLLIIIKSNYY